jgi:hypothetical protein
MKFIVIETYRETRHIVLDLPDDSTESDVRDAAYRSGNDKWESDEYYVLDFDITDKKGNAIDFELIEPRHIEDEEA